jgi:transcriptional regulator with XRE-family HTH domain
MILHQSITLSPAQGARIRRAIAALPISQAEVARRVEMAPQHLANVLTGQRPIDAERLTKVGRLAGLKIKATLSLSIEAV